MWSILMFLFWCWMALIAWAFLYTAGSALCRYWKVVVVILAVPVVIGAIMWAANAAHAQDTKEELLSTLKPSPPPPPRDCIRTANGDLVPIPRSEGDDVDMDACKEPEKKKLNIFQVTGDD